MTARKNSVFGLICGGLWLCGVATGAASVDAAGRYFQTRQGLHANILPAPLLASAQDHSEQYLGQVFEAPATVSGLVQVDGRDTALLTFGACSLDVEVPSGLQETWLASGSHIRVLVQLQAAGNGTAPPGFHLLAAAPEADVAQAEQAAATEQAARAAAIARANEAARLAAPL
ncbi:MAG: hypothetical protein M3Y13_05940, partial [Armatimonadota bacterium]|nr:hypothetical protein [Armatimonadota bacterium]